MLLQKELILCPLCWHESSFALMRISRLENLTGNHSYCGEAQLIFYSNGVALCFAYDKGLPYAAGTRERNSLLTLRPTYPGGDGRGGFLKQIPQPLLVLGALPVPKLFLLPLPK